MRLRFSVRLLSLCAGFSFAFGADAQADLSRSASSGDPKETWTEVTSHLTDPDWVNLVDVNSFQDFGGRIAYRWSTRKRGSADSPPANVVLVVADCAAKTRTGLTGNNSAAGIASATLIPIGWQLPRYKEEFEEVCRLAAGGARRPVIAQPQPVAAGTGESLGVAKPAATVDPTNPCLDALYRSAEFAPLKDQLPVSTEFNGTFSAEALSDRTKPNKLQRQALSKVVQELQRCLHQGEGWRNRHLPPELVQLHRTEFTKHVLRATDLFEGKLSFGQFNRLRYESISEAKPKLQAVLDEAFRQRAIALAQQRQQQEAMAKADDAVRAERAAQKSAQDFQVELQRQQIAAQQEMQRQQIAAQDEQLRKQAMLQLLLQNQRLSYQPIQPLTPLNLRPRTTTNCTRYGDSVNCTTQ